ncbi:glycosyltransferase [bacterium BFN5]|nr:glycosyltransferase [bacterium BFN5]
MNKPAKILFISAPIGSGHIRAAEAVSKAVTRLRPDITTRLVNVFDFFSQFFGQALLRTYLKVLGVFPRAYGTMYDWGNTSKIALLGRQVISRFLAHRMVRYIQEYQPTLIVCTHATPAGLIAYLVKQKMIIIPTIAVVTDFVVHRLWVYDEIDHYFVASEELRHVLEQYQVSKTRSRALGIPIDSVFAQPYNKQDIMTKLGVVEAFKTVLIMGGGEGVLPMAEIIMSLDRIYPSLQVIAVTGNNKKLFQQLQELQAHVTYKLKVLAFVNNIHELMAISDVLISKPGGMTSAEALSMGLPMIIYRPIPGQEEGNTKFLLEKNVAFRADSVEDLVILLNDLLENKSGNLDKMKTNARGLGRAYADKEIAQNLITNYLL